MASATFEDHPTDPDKMILRKPRLDQGADYERGFIDGMMYQTQTTVNKAVDAMSKRTWVGLMRGVRVEGDTVIISVHYGNDAARQVCGALLEEKNNGCLPYL
jgi:hypothetical protein